MIRQQVLLEILRHELSRHYEVRETCDPEWLERHPGGFSGVAPIMDGEFYRVCPDRVVALSDNLANEQFVDFCVAIRTWQRTTSFKFSCGTAPDLIVADFLVHEPGAAHILAEQAVTTNIPLDRFLGLSLQE